MLPTDRVVMELSSFQLDVMTVSPHVAAILNITPNHLDRHPSMSKHPTTPMDEADLRLLLAKQTLLPIGLFDILRVQRPDVSREFDKFRTTCPVGLVDLLYESQLATVGALLDRCDKPLFTVGSSGVEAALCAHWQQTREERVAGDALDWEVRAAQKYEHWAMKLVAAVEDGHPTHPLHIQAIRVNDVVIAAMNMEVFFETGLEIRERSPMPDTFVLGYTNGCFGYLPRAADYPEGGWKIDDSYAVPDLIPQAWAMPVILHPDLRFRSSSVAPPSRGSSGGRSTSSSSGRSGARRAGLRSRT